MTSYHLRCSRCGKELADDGIILAHDGCNPPGLLQTVYAATKPGPLDVLKGLFRYRDWLPVRRTFPGSHGAVAYRSEALARHLQLENLYITFSGYWPERGAFMRTCSFKELEAYTVLARLPDHFHEILVIASAGNTARAFINVCSQYRIPAVVIVPEWSIPTLWQERKPDDCVCIIALGGNSDYADVISLAGIICGRDGFVAEGGALNVARRDGLGTTVLTCAEEAGCIPDEYFQAVGSGTGAIAAWETSVRLMQNGVFPGGPMRLHVAQNIPFAPIYDAWTRQSRNLDFMSPYRFSSGKPYAEMLFNRKPPYGIAGGLYDALQATNGNVYGISNEEAAAASKLFEETEEIDIDPAAAVAVACLVRCIAERKVQREAFIMLNVTGGGFKRLQRDVSLQTSKPLVIMDSADVENIYPHLEMLKSRCSAVNNHSNCS